jgi:hypothetical protein
LGLRLRVAAPLLAVPAFFLLLLMGWVLLQRAAMGEE